MKVIQQDIIKAIRNNRNLQTGRADPCSCYNTGQTGYRDEVEWPDYKSFNVRLWSHLIAEGNLMTHTLKISTCGYDTVTTTSRLNAVFAALDIPMSAVIRKGNTVFLLNGREEITSEAKAGMWEIRIV